MAKQAQQIRHIWLTPSDFLDDLDYRSWDCKLCGAYWNLILTLYANKGKMPDNTQQLRLNAQWRGKGFDAAWFILREKFFIKDSIVRHKRVTKELRRARRSQQDKRRAGLNSATVRQQRSNAASTLLHEGKVRKGKVKKEPPVVPLDVPEEMNGGVGAPPFAPHEDPMLSAAANYLEAKWLDIGGDGKTVRPFRRDQIPKLLSYVGGLEQLEQLPADVFWRAWRRYANSDKRIPWSPYYVGLVLDDDAVRKTQSRSVQHATRRKQEARTRAVQAEQQADEQTAKAAMELFLKLPANEQQVWLTNENKKWRGKPPRELKILAALRYYKQHDTAS